MARAFLPAIPFGITHSAPAATPRAVCDGKSTSGLTIPESEESSDAEVKEAVEDYYQAVDGEEWAYTYDNLDRETKAMVTQKEWRLKNQWFADNGILRAGR